MEAGMRAWEVFPVDREWSVIVHADTRGCAVAKGCSVDHLDFIDMRARRIQQMDDKAVTRELMIEAGWPEERLEEPFDSRLWTFVCGCEHCTRGGEG